MTEKEIQESEPIISYFEKCIQQNISSVCWHEEVNKDLLFMKAIELRLLLSMFKDDERQKYIPSRINNGVVSIGVTGHQINLNEGLFGDPERLTQVIANYDGTQIVLTQIPFFEGTHYPLLRLYAVLNNLLSFGSYDDLKAAENLAESFHIDKERPFINIPVEREGWFRSEQPMQPISQQSIPFCNKYGCIKFCLEFKPFGKSLLYSPIIAISRMNESWPIAYRLMPEFPLPLFRSNEIYENPELPIIITESINLANAVRKQSILTNPLYNPHASKAILTTWFLGEEGIEYTDWSMIKKREIYYFLPEVNEPELKKKQLKTALSVYKKLCDEIDEKYLRFQIFRQPIQNHIFMPIKPYDFSVLCQETGLRRPEYIHDYKAEIKSAALCSLPKNIPYLIHPILTSKSLAVFFAPSNVGKTWLALSMGLAVANGVSVCSKWTAPSEERRNVLYVAGEMSEEELNNRIIQVKKAYTQHESETFDAFHYRVTHSNLGAEEGQKEIESYLQYFRSKGNPIRFMILDNLNTLVTNGEYKSTWDHFFSWIVSLQNNFSPLACLIIHHANKAGAILGTSAIKNRVDLMLQGQETDSFEEQIEKIRKNEKVLSPDEEIAQLLEKHFHNDVSMFITYEKVRFLSKKRAFPFWMRFSPEHPELGWQTENPAYFKQVISQTTGNKETAQTPSSLSDGIPITIGDEPIAQPEQSPIQEKTDATADGAVESIPEQPTTQESNEDPQNKIPDEFLECLGLTWKQMSNEHREAIVTFLHRNKKWSASKIAKKFGVSVRTIQYTYSQRK